MWNNTDSLHSSGQTNQFPLITVEGSAFEMGRQHGAQAALLIKKYLAWIERLSGKPRQVLCRNALSFLPAIKRLGPKFVKEAEGLSEGAGISFSEALLCQLRTEASHRWKGGCTALAVKGEATADRELLLGQNLDLEPEYADVAILLKVHPNDGRPRALMFTFAGQLGYSGMNEFGVAHVANALYAFRWQSGLPHYPLKRMLLEQRTVGKAIEIVRKYPVCSPGNIIVVDGKERIADIEIRPEGPAEYKDAHPDQRLHTNHHLCPEFARFRHDLLPDSVARLERIRTLVRKAWGSITLDTVKEFLADHEGDPAGICRHGACNLHSIAGYIAEPAKGILHVRRGHGCLGTWTAYRV